MPPRTPNKKHDKEEDSATCSSKRDDQPGTKEGVCNSTSYEVNIITLSGRIETNFILILESSWQQTVRELDVRISQSLTDLTRFTQQNLRQIRTSRSSQWQASLRQACHKPAPRPTLPPIRYSRCCKLQRSLHHPLCLRHLRNRKGQLQLLQILHLRYRQLHQ